MSWKQKIVLFLLLGISCTMLGQARLRRPEIYLGAHAGVMASTMLFDPSIKGMDLLQSPLGVNGGLVFRYAGHKVCAIQVEVNYMQRGWKEVIEASGNNAAVAYERKLDYIEVPLLMHLYFGGQHFRGFFNLGPQVGYCFRDVELGTKNPNYSHQYGKIDNPFDWGLAGGLGMYYRTNRAGLFQLEARFNFSFGSVFRNTSIDHFDFANPMNLSLNLAYMWEFKPRKITKK